MSPDLMPAAAYIGDGKGAFEEGPRSEPGSKHLNFWEQVGMSYSDHSRGLEVVDVMFGEAIDEAWGAWEPVIPAVWGEHTDIGRSFAALVAKIRRRRRWLCYRRKLRRFLLTPYYDRVPPGGMKPCR